MEIVFIAIGIALGAVITYLIIKNKSAAVEAQLKAEQNAYNGNMARLQEMADYYKNEGNRRLQQMKEEAERRILQQKAEEERRASQLRANYEQQIRQQKGDYEQQISQLKADYIEAFKDSRQQADEQREKELAALRRNYEEQLALFREQVTTATEKLLKDRSGELQDANTQKMEELFKPIKDNIIEMERSINETREANARNSASFEKTMQQMMESNARLGSQADRLSTALQRKNKTAGDWGELILTELLESQGLEQGVHFDVQQTIRDNDGQTIVNEDTGMRMRPDVILHLADGRDVVIDSKMSLTAYVDYQNADDEAARQEALRRHIDSVRSHVKELTGKNYSDYVAKSQGGMDFVIMFVPIDGALQLALSHNPELWREAFDKHVFIAGAQTLTAALRIIDLTWVNVKQERNTAKVMDEARKLIDRVSAFYKEFRAVGSKLEEAAKAYDAVNKRVNDGTQSILAAGRRMEQLGARGKKALEADAGE